MSLLGRVGNLRGTASNRRAFQGGFCPNRPKCDKFPADFPAPGNSAARRLRTAPFQRADPRVNRDDYSRRLAQSPPFERDRLAAARRIPARRSAAARRPPQSAAVARLRNTRHGDRHGRARRGHRQRGAADDRARPGDSERRIGVDRQRLPARGHGLTPAAVGARRQPRLPSRLLARARPLHAGVPRLRGSADLADAGRRPRRPGARRGRDHERQHRPRPIHLSCVAPRPRRRQHRARGGRMLGRKPDDRGGDPLGRLVAMAVSHQRSDRGGRARHGGAQLCRSRPPQSASVDPSASSSTL